MSCNHIKLKYLANLVAEAYANLDISIRNDLNQQNITKVNDDFQGDTVR